MTIERAVDNGNCVHRDGGLRYNRKAQGAYYETYEQGNYLRGSTKRAQQQE